MPAVGKPLPRKDAWDKVTGTVRYIDDYAFPGMVYAATVRSTVAAGTLRRIDSARALALPGVLGVFTAADIPGKNSVPLVLPDQTFLATGEVRYYGEPVALVVAETSEIAQAAAALVTLEIDAIPPILSIRESIAADSRKLFGSDNCFAKFVVRRGNAADAMSKATHVFEQEYETPYQEHAYLETQGAIAVPGLDGMMSVYGTMQCPFYVHDAVTHVLGVTRNMVRIIQTTTGGGFGGKEDFPSVVAGHAAFLAKILHRPVKLIYKREEDLIASSKRHPGLIRIKIGCNDDGMIKAAEIDYYLDGGAFATLTSIVLWRGTVHALGPYVCDNVTVKSYGVATNKVPCGAFRGFGSPQIIFAGESMIDEIAVGLNIDPVEIRRRNGLKIGDMTITSQAIKDSCGLQETISQVVDKSGWQEKWQPPQGKTGIKRRGIGISTIYYGVGLGAGGKHLDRAGASMIIMRDGSVFCAVGNVEMGQGARTVLAQIAADALGAPYELINVLEVDTATVPDSGPTVASRTTFMSGNSLIEAARQLRPQLLKAASTLLETDPDSVELVDGQARRRGDATGKRVDFPAVANQLYQERLQPSAFGWYVAPETTFNQDNGQGDAYFAYSYCTNAAEVEVDMETGEYQVLRITAAHDIGRAINPQQVEGQIEGGSLQGFGYCTMEEIRHDANGRLLNDAFATYILPTIVDAPDMQPIIVEHRHQDGPFGAKGFGEVPLMGIAPAIANALYNATGIRFRRIPIKPEQIVLAHDADTR